MPIYEYQCDGCACKFEVKQSIKDDPIKTCERCGQSVRRLISSPGIMFKGSGWYITDYSDKLKPSTGNEKTDGAGGEKAKAPTGAEKAAAPVATPAAGSSSAPTSPAPSAPSSTSKQGGG
ncbi:FmdB family zinc ribbon protein [Petrachloros mirabilis]